MECCFDEGKKCSILKIKLCLDCKFRKTKEEFDNAKKKAEFSLIDRNLGKHKDVKNGIEIVTVDPMIYI